MRKLVLDNFAGFVNKKDPQRLQFQGQDNVRLTGLLKTRNIEINDTRDIKGAPGFLPVYTGNIDNAYATIDEQQCYLVNGANLLFLNEDFTTSTIFTALDNTNIHWCEVNKEVYLTNGVDFLILNGKEVRTWGKDIPDHPTLSAGSGSLPTGQYQVTLTFVDPQGRESGANNSTAINLAFNSSLVIDDIPLLADHDTRIYISPTNADVLRFVADTSVASFTWNGPVDQLGHELESLLFYPPTGGLCTHSQWPISRIYISRYLESMDRSVILASEPISYEWFDYTGGIMATVPGKVVLLEATKNKTGVLIGTDQAIYKLGNENEFDLVAEYGAVPGYTSTHLRDGRIIFQSQEGTCVAFPFDNLTYDLVSTRPAAHGTGILIEKGGFDRYWTILEDAGLSTPNPF